jgi:hypothetical protein
MYIVRSNDVYVSVEPTLDYQPNDFHSFPITFAWTSNKAEAVRFASRWHAKAVARALKRRRVTWGDAVTVIAVRT